MIFGGLFVPNSGFLRALGEVLVQRFPNEIRQVASFSFNLTHKKIKGCPKAYGFEADWHRYCRILHLSFLPLIS
jgi:hypothetical protein